MTEGHHVFPFQFSGCRNLAAVGLSERRETCHRVYTVGNRSVYDVIGLSHLIVRHQCIFARVQFVPVIQVEHLVLVIGYREPQIQTGIFHIQKSGRNRRLYT